MRDAALFSALLLALLATTAAEEAPYGLDGRPPVGPYLNNAMPPMSDGFAFPPVLSATGAFRDVRTLTPSDGLIPFAPNSPLWTDGAIKSRWMAVPNDGPPYEAAEQIGFAPVGEWSFPNGTVFVKHFELTVNEATGERKRLETRLLVRDSQGAVYGVTYKWRSDQSDADLLPDGFEENVAITAPNGQTRLQRYSYPSRAECLFCHNAKANYILGLNTHQLNGDFHYPATGRTDNQLRTFNRVGLLNPAPREESFASYLRSVAVTDTTATVQHRMRSWIDANCSHCHRPGGFSPGYDGRFSTPLDQQNLIDTYVRFRDLAGSELYQRDNALDDFKMPPIAKNVVHGSAMATLRQWIASPLQVLSVTLHEDAQHLAVRFNSRVDLNTVVPSNFTLNRGAVVTHAELGVDPDVVILTVSPLGGGEPYMLTTSNVQDTAPSANTIWPRSLKSFAANFAVASAAPRLANISTRVEVGRAERVLVAGFIARGEEPKRVMLRGIGPSLKAAGISGVLANPSIELFDSRGTSIATNDDWQENANVQEIIDSGIAPRDDREAAILTTFPASGAGTAYTFVLRGADNGTGAGLVEAYDLDRGAEDGELVNISTRGLVQTGNNVMIGGVIITGASPQRVIVRALGPSLPVAGKLNDPVLEIYNGNGERIATNNNWREAQEAEITATGIPPADEFESAIVRTLTPAPYTAVVRGVNETTGVALVEVYALD